MSIVGLRLKSDVQTIANFKVMAGAIDTVFLVEASPILREAQRKLLCGDEPMQEHSMGQQSVCKRIPNAKVVWVEDIKFIPRGLSITFVQLTSQRHANPPSQKQQTPPS